MAAEGPLRGQGGRGRQAARRRDRPLRRTPKQLSQEPTLFQLGGGQGGALVPARRTDDKRTRPGRGGTTTPGSTEEHGDLVPVPTDGAEAGWRVDPEVRRRARRIAAKLALARPRVDSTARRGRGDFASVRYRGGSDEIDLDATMEVLTERPIPEEDDIIVRERVRTRRSVVVAVDVSGSMRGERVRTAAATVGALAGELARDDLGVLAFWSDAAVLLPLGRPVRPLAVLDALLRLPAKGLTNVDFPLRVAAHELARVPARDARVLLLSDCVHNAGPDPRHIAARLARLDVLLDVTGEHDEELARDLARSGRGRLMRLRRHQDVAPAVTRIFAS